jgi:hypothetical protein
VSLRHAGIAITMPAVSDSPRRLHLVGSAVAALAAVLLVLGSWSTSWWSGADGDMTFSAGPRLVELCGGGECQDAALSTVGSSAWMQLGLVALTAGVVGSVLLLAAVARVLLRPGGRSALPSAAGLACAAGVVVGIAFVWVAPPEVASLAFGWSVLAYFAGAAIGAGSAALLRP